LKDQFWTSGNTGGVLFSFILGIQNAAKSKNCAIFKPKHLNASFLWNCHATIKC